MIGLVLVEGIETFLVIDALRCSVEQDGIAIEGDAHFPGVRVGRYCAGQDQRCRHAPLMGLHDLRGFGAEEDVTMKNLPSVIAAIVLVAVLVMYMCTFQVRSTEVAIVYQSPKRQA